MEPAAWRAVERAIPGPLGVAAWIAATLPAPLMFFEATHRWEERQDVSAALWWVLGALPVLSATVAARWTWHTGQRRTLPAFLTAVGAATLIGAVFLVATLAAYRWVVPLQGAVDWPDTLLGGVLLAVAGGAVGHLVGLGKVRRGRLAHRHGHLVGGIVAVLGALLAQTTVQLGAEGSTSRYDVLGYGDVGPYAATATGPGMVALPAAGRYAILAVGFAPQNPDCRVTGGAVAGQPAELVTIAPGGYGTDAASYAWVASFDVPGPGTYSLACRSSDEEASYVVWETPDVRGVVGAMIHWPLAAIWLLGALPGLLVIAKTAARRRAGRQETPASA
ncbi:hypothetical protein [Micromonospora sp. KLBMP9576]|uniref:hypothetical protein n=1 Tax=Micromonospora sp. KLBMP9576 TaxID=3424769 RepID=UPI003D8D39F5